uniref:Uncharacterized protein n=1 Tax=Physcomitrium patens TaxID=3218 RepID=A0A7I4FGI3_PHYPA
MKIITDVTLGALLFEGLNLPVAARNLAETNTGRRASRLKFSRHPICGGNGQSHRHQPSLISLHRPEGALQQRRRLKLDRWSDAMPWSQTFLYLFPLVGYRTTILHAAMCPKFAEPRSGMQILFEE